MNRTEIRQHQELVRQNIAAAIECGDVDRAVILQKTYADLLAIKLPKLDTGERVPASPINPIQL